MKTCNDCKQEKSLDEFAWKVKAKGTKSNKCRSCQSEYAKLHYASNKAPYKERAKISNPRSRKTNRDYIYAYLERHPCMDCGESDIVVLQFDHRTPVGQKAPRVTNLINYSIAKIQEEIDKCDVVCANCHVRRTAKMFNWSRLEYNAPLV